MVVVIVAAVMIVVVMAGRKTECVAPVNNAKISQFFTKKSDGKEQTNDTCREEQQEGVCCLLLSLSFSSS